MTEQGGSTLGPSRLFHLPDEDGDLTTIVPVGTPNPAQFSPRAIEEAMNRPYPPTFHPEATIPRFQAATVPTSERVAPENVAAEAQSMKPSFHLLALFPRSVVTCAFTYVGLGRLANHARLRRICIRLDGFSGTTSL